MFFRPVLVRPRSVSWRGDHLSALLVCHDLNGHKWFARAPSATNKWFPRNTLDAHSFAFDVLHGGKPGDPIPVRLAQMPGLIAGKPNSLRFTNRPCVRAHGLVDQAAFLRKDHARVLRRRAIPGRAQIGNGPDWSAGTDQPTPPR
jgi:hypothetical protein